MGVTRSCYKAMKAARDPFILAELLLFNNCPYPAKLKKSLLRLTKCGILFNTKYAWIVDSESAPREYPVCAHPQAYFVLGVINFKLP